MVGFILGVFLAWVIGQAYITAKRNEAKIERLEQEIRELKRKGLK